MMAGPSLFNGDLPGVWERFIPVYPDIPGYSWLNPAINPLKPALNQGGGPWRCTNFNIPDIPGLFLSCAEPLSVPGLIGVLRQVLSSFDSSERLRTVVYALQPPSHPRV